MVLLNGHLTINSASELIKFVEVVSRVYFKATEIGFAIIIYRFILPLGISVIKSPLSNERK
jgi:hypothetical protein